MNSLSVLKAVLLGVVQGATEFLPVSSSGHLVIAQEILGIEIENGGLVAFDVCLHFGTLVAVIAFFWREISEMISSLVRRPSDDRLRSGMSVREARKLAFLIIIGTIPAGVLGILLEDFFDSLFSNPLAAGFMLLVTGAILWGTRFVKGEGAGVAGMGVRHALLVGFAQAIAIIPGISRSGSTIAGGLYTGLSRDLAAKYAFLLSVPAIGGAALLKAKDLAALSGENAFATAVGTLAATVVGFACIKWLLGVVRRGHISWFAPYCWAAGLATLIYIFVR
ncbi:MAG: undecaprenyl-diphosphate phosphatase [bacterium]